MKALRSFVLLFTLICQVMLPTRAYAFAFVPAVMAAGSLGPITEAVVGAIVGGVAFLGFGAIAGDSRSGQVATTPAGIAIPQGWTAGTNAAPVPPSTTSTSLVYYIQNYSGFYATPQLAANTVGPTLCGNIGRTFSSATILNSSTARFYCSGGYMTDQPYGSQTACATGYTKSGSSCVLSDATAVAKPATAANGSPLPCQIINGSTGYKYDPQNGRCPAVDTPIAAGDGSGRTMVAHGDGTFSLVPALPATTPQAKAAEPTLTGEKLPNGGTRLTQTIPYIGADGLPYTAKLITELDADGKVIGQSGTTTAGTGSLGGGAVVPPIDINCQKTNTCDVATDSTLKDVKAATEELRDRMKASTDTFAPPSAADYNPAIQALNNLRPSPNQFTGPVTDMLRSLGVPSAGTQCELKRTLTLMGHEFQINMAPEGICGPYQEIANWMTWMLVILYGWGKVRGMTSNSLEG